MSRCKNGHRRTPKHIPYGGKRGKYWCRICDQEKVPDYAYKNRKKTARQKGKRETKDRVTERSVLRSGLPIVPKFDNSRQKEQ